MWKVKNNDEYAVFAKTKEQAKAKFKRDLGMTIKLKDLVKIN